MLITPFFRFGVPQDAPTLTLTSGSSDNTPDFILSGDLAELDTVREQHSQDAAFVTGVFETTNTIDAAEDAANELDFSTGALANGTWYFRMRDERPPRGITAWSNTETLTISVAGEGGPISLFGRWLGGFGNPNLEGGPISLFGRWLGGFGSTSAVVVTPPTPDVVNTEVGGDRIVGGTFSRGKWRNLKEEWAAAVLAQEAAERKALEVTGKRRKALQAAAKAADEAILAHEQENASRTEEGAKLARLLKSAVGVKSLADTVRLANAARDYAVKLQAEMEEEEEAMVLLLMN